jgi:hypothetical protein
MSQSSDISISGVNVGRILFEEAPARIEATTTATGLNIIMPFAIEFRSLTQPELRSDLYPVLSNIRATISTGYVNQSAVEIGFAQDYYRHMGAKDQSSRPGQLIWSCSSQSLFRFEQIRNGGVPEICIQLWAEAYYQLPSNVNPQLRLLTEPSLVSGQVKLRYPREVWIAMLNRVGAGLSILVEVPLPAARPTPWDGVWRALKEARDAFEQGGTTGWQNCVANIRQAFDTWRDIQDEREDLGEWTPPSVKELELRTKKQRFDLVRWHLRQITHLAHHGPADQWSRDEALFMLSALASLLSIRKP